MATTDGVKRALGALGGVMAVPENVLTTADAWNIIRASYGRYGAGPLPFTLGDVSSAIGQLNAVRRAAQQFEAAPIGEALTYLMVAQLPGTEITAAGQLEPQWLVRFQATFTIGGVQTSDNFSITYRGGLPVTKRSLLNDAFAASTGFVEEYTGLAPDSIDAITDVTILGL